MTQYPVTTQHLARDSSGPIPAADLLQAALSLASDLDLTSVLRRFVVATSALTGARYGAINVLDSRGESTTFVQSGVDERLAQVLGRGPHAVGVLSAIPREGSMRLDDLTQHPAFGGFPPGHPPMGSFLGAAVTVRDVVYGYLYLCEKPGGFTDDDDATVQTLAAAVALAIQNAELYAASERRERWVRAGQEISTMLLSGAEDDEVLTHIASSSRQVAAADTAALVLPGVGNDWVMEIVDGMAADQLLGTVMPPDSRAHSTLATGAGLLVEHLGRAKAVQIPLLRPFGPALYAPLVAKGRGLGVLMLLRRVGSTPFSGTDLATAQAFAAQAALALVLAEVRHAHDVAALLDERERIARDLHDLAIQQLFATGLQLESVRRRAPQGIDPSELTRLVGDALDNVDSTVKEIRSIVHVLRDPDAAAPLTERLRREASLARTGLGFAPSLLVRTDGRVLGSADSLECDVAAVNVQLGEDVADDVVAVMREGLANAARHAHATAVAVTVDICGDDRGGTVTVLVDDDGTGLPSALPRRSGTDNLAARARRHGGSFTLTASAQQPGTHMVWRVPLPATSLR